MLQNIGNEGLLSENQTYEDKKLVGSLVGSINVIHQAQQSYPPISETHVTSEL